MRSTRSIAIRSIPKEALPFRTAAAAFWVSDDRLAPRVLAFILGLGTSCSMTQIRGAHPESHGIDGFVDRDFDPCTDFYRFACGNWVSEHAPEPLRAGAIRERRWTYQSY